MCGGKGGTLQTNTAGMCGECSQWMDHTGFATAQGGVCFPDLHCLVSRVPCKGTVPMGPAFHALPRSTLPRSLGAPQGHRRRCVVHFVPFSSPSSSGDQVLGEHTLPGGPCVLFTSPVLAAQFPRCTMRTQSQVCHVFPLGS